ncbi:MAG: hypothetical protein WCP36_09390 [Methanomicrobiales archaeon]
MKQWSSSSHNIKKQHTLNDTGVSTTIEYLMISGVLITLMIITMLMVNSFFVEQPMNRVRDDAFVDIGNGISTRIVDLYIIAPPVGSITSNFNIPDSVAGRSYNVRIEGLNENEMITVEADSISHKTSLSGIGATLGVKGSTTGSGLNRLSYYSDREE